MRSFEDSLGRFSARRVHVVGISVDPPEITRQHRLKQGYTFTFLSDTQGEVLRMYDLLHLGAGPEGTDIARPAEFLIDASGVVRWADLTESYVARARPEEILTVLDGLEPAS